MSKLLILYYLVFIHISICLGDCGLPGQPANVDVYDSEERSKEGDEVTYDCEDHYRLIGDNKRKCENGKWTGKVPRCAKYLEQDLIIQKLSFSYMDEEKSYQVIKMESKRLINFNDQSQCLRLNESKKIEFNITISTEMRISSVDLYYFNRNETQRRVRHIPLTRTFVSQSKRCVPIGHFHHNQRQRTEFICDPKEGVNLLEEKIEISNFVSFEFESEDEKRLQLSICQVKLYQVPEDCGSPDIPLHASVKYKNSGRQALFSPQDKERYQLLGDPNINCISDGKWFPSPPIIKPIIICPIQEALPGNNTGYIKDIKDYDYFNGTMVAIIDTRLIFKCMNNDKLFQRNRTNSSGEIMKFETISGPGLNFTKTCDKNGKWKGSLPDCPKSKSKIDQNELNKKEGTNTLIIIIISLITFLAIFGIALSIFGAYLIILKKKNKVKLRKIEKNSRRGSANYYHEGELVRRHHDNDSYESIIMENHPNIYDVTRNTDDYDELYVERYDVIAIKDIDVNHKDRYEVIHGTTV